MTSTTTTPPPYKIKPATPSDLQLLPTIEASAAKLFVTDPTLAPIAGYDPMNVSDHQGYLQKWQTCPLDIHDASGTWVAVHQGDGREEIVGFIVTQPLGVKVSNLERYFVHIKELSVHVEHQRKGLASRLISAVKDFAVSLNANADGGKVVGMSLTTFRDVVFNGPFYARFGFEEVPSEGEGGIGDVLGEEGLKIWKEEQELFAGVGDGSLRGRRCCMVLMLEC